MLDVQGLSKTFGGLHAVSDASIRVDEGEIISRIGPNGAGKTTLFAMISGFLKADQGQVTFNDFNITGWRPHRICRIGLARTFQVVQPFTALSVRENIAVGAHTRIRSRTEALRQAEDVAHIVGMGNLLDMQAGSLTVAGRKRLELARVLATSPKLLLLDEVMAGLNATEIEEIIGVVRDIQKSGVTILLIEHVMQAVMSLSDRTYVLNNGKMIANGTPQEVTQTPEVIEAYLGHGAAERIAAMQADAAGGDHA